jgi:hypothetical protein
MLNERSSWNRCNLFQAHEASEKRCNTSIRKLCDTQQDLCYKAYEMCHHASVSLKWKIFCSLGYINGLFSIPDAI